MISNHALFIVFLPFSPARDFDIFRHLGFNVDCKKSLKEKEKKEKTNTIATRNRHNENKERTRKRNTGTNSHRDKKNQIQKFQSEKNETKMEITFIKSQNLKFQSRFSIEI